jgi:hypothetical protein
LTIIGLANITSSIPSSFTLLTTNVSVPLLADISSVSGYLSTTIRSLTKTALAFYIVAIIGAGVTFLCSLIGLFISTSMPLLYTNIAFSFLGSTSLIAASIGITFMATIISNAVNSVGKSVGLSVNKGAKFMVLTWISWGLLALANIYWSSVWFVEFRKHAVTFRKRSEQEIGNWRGIGGELRRDFKR